MRQQHETMRDTGRWLPVGCLWTFLGLALIVIIVGSLTRFGFWLDTQNAKHQNQVGAVQASGQASIAQNSWSYNSGINDALDAAWQQMHSDQEALSQEPSYAQADTKAAVLSDGQQVCLKLSELHQNIVPANPDIVSWAKINCDGTDVSPTSPLRK